MRHNLARARAVAAARLVSLYTSDDGDGAIGIVVGAESLDDVVERLDAQERVAQQDARLGNEVTRFAEDVQARQVKLREQERAAARIAAARAAQRRAIEVHLRERERLLTSVRAEVARLQAADRKRQMMVAAQVRARLAAERRAAAEARRPSTAATPAAAPQPAPPVDERASPSRPPTETASASHPPDELTSNAPEVRPPTPIPPPAPAPSPPPGRTRSQVMWTSST